MYFVHCINSASGLPFVTQDRTFPTLAARSLKSAAKTERLLVDFLTAFNFKGDVREERVGKVTPVTIPQTQSMRRPKLLSSAKWMSEI